MLFMKLVIKNKINHPVYLEIPIPVEVMNAIRSSEITGTEFLFYEQGAEGKLATPPTLQAQTELLDFHHYKRG